MTRPTVRCRCGHRVLAKEVLRTDLYERPSGREYVYVKYRCKRCKRLGETFVAESRWDWRIFEASRNEMSEAETEVFSSQAPISAEEILDFHCQLAEIENTSELNQSELHKNELHKNELSTNPLSGDMPWTNEPGRSAPPNTQSTLNQSTPQSTPGAGETGDQSLPESGFSKLRPDAKRDFKSEAKNENKSEPKTQPGRDESTHGNHPQRES